MDDVTADLLEQEDYIVSEARIYGDVNRERRNAHIKHRDKPNGGSMEMVTDPLDASWVPVIGEEWGEVQKVINDYRHGLYPGGLPEALAHMRMECIQTMAMLAAFVDTIDSHEPESMRADHYSYDPKAEGVDHPGHPSNDPTLCGAQHPCGTDWCLLPVWNITSRHSRHVGATESWLDPENPCLTYGGNGLSIRRCALEDGHEPGRQHFFVGPLDPESAERRRAR